MIHFNQAFSALSHTAKKSSVSKIDCCLNFSIVRIKLRQTFQAESLATLRIRFAKFQIVRGNLRNLRMPSNSVKQDIFKKNFFPLAFIYDSIATVGEIRVYRRADFQSGSRVLKKVF